MSPWYVEVDGKPKCTSRAAEEALLRADEWCKCQVREWETGYELVKRLAALMPESEVRLVGGPCPEHEDWKEYKRRLVEAGGEEEA